MSNYNLIKSVADEILNLAHNEFSYLDNDNLSEEELDKFVKKKEKLREKLSTLLSAKELNSNEKKELKEILTAAYNIEIEIGKVYKLKVEKLNQNLVNLNIEKKLQEAYAKGGMNFTNENGNHLK